MSDRIRKRTKYLTVCAMLAALGVVLMGIGSLFDVLDLTAAVLASMLCIYAVIELGGFYPWMIWLSSSILGFLLLPMKTPAIFYALFFGFYPILKALFERMKTPLCWIFKLLAFHASLALIVLLLRLFLPSMLDMGGMAWLPPVLYVMCLFCFLVYDVALTRVITLYLVRWRDRFRIRSS